MHLRVKGSLARSELGADPEATAVGLGRKLDHVEELETAKRTGPRWVPLDMQRKYRSQEGTTRSRGTGPWPAVGAAAAEVFGQRFESSAVSIAVASAVESSYDRRWAVLSHLVENQRHLWHVDLYDKATGEDGGSWHIAG